MKAKTLFKKSPTYTAIYATMLDYQLAYLNGVTFRSNVRRKRPSEDAKIWDDVIMNTASMPLCRYIVDTINDTVFSQKIDRDLEFCTPDGAEIDDELLINWTELFCYDADLNSRSLDAVMEEVGQLNSIFGHCWVSVDMNNESQGFAGRPYVVPISPLQVWDWHFMFVNGKYIPSYVKILESEDNTQMNFKVFYLGTATEPSRWESYRIDKLAPQDVDAELTGTGFYPPGMSLPLFISFTRRDPRFPDLGVSDIDSATQTQKEVYKLECEAYQSIQFAKTLIRADAGVKVPANAGGIVRATQGQIETLTVDTQDVDRISKKQMELIEQLENLTGLGGLRTSKTQAQSGVSIIEERRSLYRVASSKARELEITEEKIWTYAARFMAMRWAGNIVYGTNYEQCDTRMKISKLEVARNLSGDNPIIKQLIDQQVLDMLVDDEDMDYYKQKMVQLNPAGYIEESIDQNEDLEIESNDLGSQLPREIPEIDRKAVEDGVDTLGPLGAPVVNLGVSSVDPAADILLGKAGGR